VIFFFDMDKFMDEDVIDDGQGGHDNSPAKRQAIVPRARAPSGLGACDLYPFGEQLKSAAVMNHPLGYPLLGRPFIPLAKKIPCFLHTIAVKDEFAESQC
jgi:hypothetical protein